MLWGHNPPGPAWVGRVEQFAQNQSGLIHVPNRDGIIRTVLEQEVGLAIAIEVDGADSAPVLVARVARSQQSREQQVNVARQIPDSQRAVRMLEDHVEVGI